MGSASVTDRGLAELSRDLERLAAPLAGLAAEDAAPAPSAAAAPMAAAERRRLLDALRRFLAEARRAQGLRQADFARRLGRPQSFVTSYERGGRRLEVAEFVEIARALGLDPAALLAELGGGSPTA